MSDDDICLKLIPLGRSQTCAIFAAQSPSSVWSNDLNKNDYVYFTWELWANLMKATERNTGRETHKTTNHHLHIKAM